MSTSTWIAEEQVVFVHPDGRRESGRIAIGMPVQIDSLESRCAVVFDGFTGSTRPIAGPSTLQALVLAVRFLGYRLHDFGSKGGRVVDAAGEDVHLETTFGPLLRHPGP